jgi:hypothetical protein
MPEYDWILLYDSPLKRASSRKNNPGIPIGLAYKGNYVASLIERCSGPGSALTEREVPCSASDMTVLWFPIISRHSGEPYSDVDEGGAVCPAGTLSIHSFSNIG